MRNSIIETYLNRCSKSNVFKQKVLVQQFAAELKKIHSAYQLNELICRFLEQNKDAPIEITHLFKLQDFLQRLQEWKQDLDLRIRLAEEIRLKLATLQPPENTEGLIKFLRSLLDIPEILLHQRALSLLHHLNKEHLKDTFAYLAALDKAPWPKHLARGSYLAIVPTDISHVSCLFHLNNNSFAYNHSNTYCEDANSILQTALAMFEDTRVTAMPELESLVYEEDTDVREKSTGLLCFSCFF